jgi:hypothetical protein
MDWILRRSSRSRAVAVIALLLCPIALSQAPGGSAGQPETVLDVLHELSDQADVIFAGQVLAIRHPSSGVVEVDFRVHDAIRGCTAGTAYTLREWDGLWVVNNQRYRVGQRLLMLLHAPGAAGMSSPVSGLDGAIPIRLSGGGEAADSSADSSAPQRPYVDLRWLGAKVPHAVSYRSEADAARRVALAASSFVQATPLVAASGSVTSANPAAPAASGTAGGSVAAQQASVDAVLGMLTAWEKVRNGAP